MWNRFVHATMEKPAGQRQMRPEGGTAHGGPCGAVHERWALSYIAMLEQRWESCSLWENHTGSVQEGWLTVGMTHVEQRLGMTHVEQRQRMTMKEQQGVMD